MCARIYCHTAPAARHLHHDLWRPPHHKSYLAPKHIGTWNTHSSARVPRAELGMRKQHPPPPLQFGVSLARHRSPLFSLAEPQPPAAALTTRLRPDRRACPLWRQRLPMSPDAVCRPRQGLRSGRGRSDSHCARAPRSGMSIRPAPPACQAGPSPAQTTPVHLDSATCRRASLLPASPRPPIQPDIRNDSALRPARILMLSLHPPRVTSRASRVPCPRASPARPWLLALA